MLSIAELRSEFQELFSKNSFPTFLFDMKANWDGIMTKIVTDLLDKPLVARLPTPEEVAAGRGTSAMTLRLVPEQQTDRAPIFWEIELGPQVRVRGQLLKTGW